MEHHKKKKDIRTKRDRLFLQKASECLAQELIALRMTAEAHQLIIRRSDIPQIIRNALILAFAIHFRNIFDFLYSGHSAHTPKEDDLLAEDFFDVPLFWHQILPLKRDSLVSDRKKLHKQTAHMTSLRLGANIEDRTWNFLRVLQDLSPAIFRFAESVDPKNIDSTLRGELSCPFWRTLHAEWSKTSKSSAC